MPTSSRSASEAAVRLLIRADASERIGIGHVKRLPRSRCRRSARGRLGGLREQGARPRGGGPRHRGRPRVRARPGGCGRVGRCEGNFGHREGHRCRRRAGRSLRARATMVATRARRASSRRAGRRRARRSRRNRRPRRQSEHRRGGDGVPRWRAAPPRLRVRAAGRGVPLDGAARSRVGRTVVR